MTGRHLLDRVYGAAAWAGALFMIGTLVAILLSVFGRLLDFHVRGTDAYAGYCMAASAFLALAHTLRRGEHIRVTLIIERLSGTPRRVLEWLTLAFGAGIACTLAFYSVRLVLNSHEFNDISQGVDATPLWIPQLGMAAGAVVLAIAFLDDLLLMSLGKPVDRLAKHSQEPAHME
mgnify:CR=1 FL=1